MSTHAMQSSARPPEPTPGAPNSPSPREEIVAALQKISVLHGLSYEEFGWLADHGVEHTSHSGDVLFREGQPAVAMIILLQGEIHVRREHGGGLPLFIGRAGQITGRLPYSRMKTYGGVGFAVGDVHGLAIDHSLFDEMLAAIPSMAQRSVSMLLDRVREVTRIEQQSEKLNALGKLAGNLAHELNNPASAAQRSASGLLAELGTYGHAKYELGAICLNAEDLAAARAWQNEMKERARSVKGTGAALAEEGLARWFREHGFSKNLWRITPELSETGVQPEDLDRLDASLNGRSIEPVLRQFASSIRAQSMTEAMLDATARIFELIGAIKDYSYMDQAPIQEIDIPQGIESTLAMLQSRLKGIELRREYAENLPTISAYGSELNQVWMALLENSIDSIAASERKGCITVSVAIAGPLLLIEIWDNGHGIPDDMQDRIFEPFFTTRAPGSGLGLGLDMAQRVVHKHRGYIRVQSNSEATCFQVRLPIEQLQAY